jgi:hypothetical protein
MYFNSRKDCCLQDTAGSVYQTENRFCWHRTQGMCYVHQQFSVISTSWSCYSNCKVNTCWTHYSSSGHIGMAMALGVSSCQFNVNVRTNAKYWKPSLFLILCDSTHWHWRENYYCHQHALHTGCLYDKTMA